MFYQSLAILSLLWLPLSGFGQMDATKTQEILRQSALATHTDWERAPRFDFCKRDETKAGSRTYAILMIAGSPYNRLVQEDGHNLSPEQELLEQEKHTDTIQQRQHETAEQWETRTAQYQRERRRNQELLEQLTRAMDFTFVRTEVIDSHLTHEFEASPRPRYAPPNREARVLTAMKGRLWVDQAAFRWVKIQAEVVKPVSIVGFLARVQPGTRFSLEQNPVLDDIWMPRHFAMRSRTKIAWFFDKSSQVDETYFNYRPSGTLSIDSCKNDTGIDH